MNHTREEIASESPVAAANRRAALVFCLVIAGLTAFALLYSVTRAFVWDEGYHLMAALQISHGKSPYIDFCFPQTPLNAYLNGAIIRLFGEHWQPIHIVATSLSMGCMFLTAQYMLARFPVPRWRLGIALAAAVFVGLNTVVIEFGSIGQAYGICLFFTVAAYRVAVITPARVSSWLPLSAGLLAGIAAGSSLLTAPILPVLLLWIWFYDRVGLRWRKAAAFIIGVAVAFLPVALLYLKGPEQTLFNIVKYHALYRRVDWPGATFHDLHVFTSWLDSTQGLTLALLSVAGIFFLRQNVWDRAQRSEFYLAAWIAAAETAYLCTPHPTFGRYFIFLVPFLTIVAMAGLYSLGSKMGYEQRPAWPTGIAAVCGALMFGSFAVQIFDETTWQEYEKVARKMLEVTPKGGRVFADELVYFAMQIDPPSGMECSYTHVLNLPPAQEKLEHLISESEIKAQFLRHDFVTAQSCSDSEMDRIGLPGTYAHRVDLDDCTIFWGERPK